MAAVDKSVEAVRRESEAAVRAYVAGGGKAVGFVTPAAPVELIEAAGLMAAEILPGDVCETPRADEIMEDLFHPPVRALLERVMRGDFAHLSAIVCPRAADAPHRLYYYLCELERIGVAVPKPLLFDVVQTPGEASERYSLGRLTHLWSELQAIGGKGGDGELRAAIKAGNRRRASLKRVCEMRGGWLGELSGAEALAVFAESRMLSAAKLEATCAYIAQRHEGRRAEARVVIAGSAHDDAGLHELVEEAGGNVAGDFHAGGELGVGPMIDEAGDPLAALCAAYRPGRAGSRSFENQAQAIVEFATGVGAKAVLFSYFPEEEALTWDFPEQAAALRAAGIAVERLGPQSRPYDKGANAAAVRAVIESLKVRR